jgi:hypothetical protein
MPNTTERCQARFQVGSGICPKPPIPGKQHCFWHSADGEDCRNKTPQKVLDALHDGELPDAPYFRDASFAGARFGGQKLTAARFVRCDLRRVDLARANLWKAEFGDENDCSAPTQLPIDLREADLTGADVHQGSFHGVNLSDARLNGANLSHVRFNKCCFDDADFEGANTLGATFTGIAWGSSFRMRSEREGRFADAAKHYRALERAIRAGGPEDVADRLRYRYLECRRKSTPRLGHRLVLTLLWLVSGYGERPARLLWWSTGLWAATSALLAAGGRPLGQSVLAAFAVLTGEDAGLTLSAPETAAAYTARLLCGVVLAGLVAVIVRHVAGDRRGG